MGWVEMQPLDGRLTVARRAVAVEMLEAYGEDRAAMRELLLDQKPIYTSVTTTAKARRLAERLHAICDGAYRVRACRGRLAQDDAFRVEELAGRYLAELLAVYERSHRDEPICLYLRAADDEVFHRFFIDAGLAFWEDWGGLEELEPFDEYVDLGGMWGLEHIEIEEVVAFPNPENATLRIRLMGRGAVELSPSVLGDCESVGRLVYRNEEGIEYGV